MIVSAPTGQRKTVAGELAIAYALAQDKRVLYTTPLKALSSQKFEDFCQFFGSENVGLSAGDSGVRRDAPVVVMTTEIYRNMLYEDAPTPFAVVFDEFHYMNDPSRGTVWEGRHLFFRETKLVALSATVSNDEQLKELDAEDSRADGGRFFVVSTGASAVGCLWRAAGRRAAVPRRGRRPRFSSRK